MEDSIMGIWNDVLESAGDILPQGTSDRWLTNCSPISLSNGVLKISVIDKFAKGMIDERIAPHVASYLSKKGIADRVETAVEAKDDRARTEASVKHQSASSHTAPSTERSAQRSSNGLDPNYVFETFIEGSSNRLAYNASLAISEAPGVRYNPLFIWGGVGLGKTHLMHAIAHRILELKPSSRVLFTTSEKFTNEFIASLRSGGISDFRTRYRSLDMLLIDDIQFLSNKDGTQEEFFNTFNTMRNAGGHIVISSDRPPRDIQDIEDRLVNRFEQGLSVDIKPPDYETRAAILRKKAELQNYTVPDEVINYIAENITSNIRRLEGALNQVMANSQLNGEPLSTDNLAVWLKDISRSGGESRLSFDLIQDLVSNSFGITTEDLISSSRTSEINLARQIAMYLCRDVLKAKNKDIAQMFGKKDHTTVIHACKKIEDLMREDTRVRAIVENVRGKL